MASEILISVVEGQIAPRYSEDFKEFELKNVIITTQGMESGRPLVDLVLVDKEDNKIFAMVSGRLIAQIGDKVKELNLKGGNDPYKYDSKKV